MCCLIQGRNQKLWSTEFPTSSWLWPLTAIPARSRAERLSHELVAGQHDTVQPTGICTYVGGGLPIVQFVRPLKGGRPGRTTRDLDVDLDLQLDDWTVHTRVGSGLPFAGYVVRPFLSADILDIPIVDQPFQCVINARPLDVSFCRDADNSRGGKPLRRGRVLLIMSSTTRWELADNTSSPAFLLDITSVVRSGSNLPGINFADTMWGVRLKRWSHPAATSLCFSQWILASSPPPSMRRSDQTAPSHAFDPRPAFPAREEWWTPNTVQPAAARIWSAASMAIPWVVAEFSSSPRVQRALVSSTNRSAWISRTMSTASETSHLPTELNRRWKDE